MLGGVIGDLAAWTWEQDREKFYPDLISPSAELSVCGTSIMEVFEKGMSDSSEEMRLHGLQKWSPISAVDQIAFLIALGWLQDPGEQNLWSYYLARFLRKSPENALPDEFFMLPALIFYLRQGCTKQEALQKVGNSECLMELLRFNDLHLDYEWNSEKSGWFEAHLGYALNCFQSSYDFTSAIHAAMKCPGNRHLAGMLAGAVADAMYGCAYFYFKKKFIANKKCCSSSDWISSCNWPKTLSERQLELLRKMDKYCFSVRIFYPKNRSETNVERFLWKSFDDVHENQIISDEYHRRFMKSYMTGFDYRYGVYLDDGWFYIFRSHYLLCRFQMIKEEKGWRTVHFQISGAKDIEGVTIAISSVFKVIEKYWFLASGEPHSSNLYYCRYFSGESECPFELYSVQGKFWQGEKMFIEGNQDIQLWELFADDFMKTLKGEKLIKFQKFPLEGRAIFCYVANHFGKWCPYDDLEWMWQY